MKNLLLITTLLLAIICNAQYYTSPVASGNPNNINQEDFEYPLGGGLPSGWTSILSGGKTNPTWSSAQTIPFTFQFNDTTVTSFKASSSGVVTFTTTVSGTAHRTQIQLCLVTLFQTNLFAFGVFQARAQMMPS